MGDFIRIRIPPEIKNEMDRLKGEINRNREIGEFIKRRIKEYKKRKTLDEVAAYIGTLKGIPKGTASASVREDRDSR